MKTLTWPFLLVVLIFGTIVCPAEDITYFWDSPDVVYLWLAADDTEPVVARFNLSEKKWTVTPPPSQEWMPKIKEIAKAVSQKDAVEIEKYKNEVLWQFVLSHLRNSAELGLQVRNSAIEGFSGAKRRKFDTEIYILPGEDRQKAEVAFLWGKLPNTEKVDTIYTFTRKAAAGTTVEWSKDKDVVLEKVLGVDRTSAEDMDKIFGLKKDEQLPANSADWNIFWDAWIKRSLEAKDPRFDSYKSQGTKTTFLVKTLPVTIQGEKVRLPRQVERLYFVQPNALTGIDLSPIEGVDGEKGGFFKGLLIFYILWTVLGVIILLAYFAWKGIRSSSTAPHGTTEIPANALVSAEGLKYLHDTALAHVQNAMGGPDNPANRVLFGSINYAFEQYSRILSSNDFKDKAGDLNYKVIAAHHKEIGLEDQEAVKLGNWVKIGRASEGVRLEEIRTLAAVKSVCQQFPQLRLQTVPEFLSAGPQIFTEMDKKIGELTSKNKSVNDQLVELKRQGDAELEKEKNKLEVKYQDQLKESDKKYKAAESNFSATSAKLITATDENRNLETNIQNLQTTITRMTKEKESDAALVTKYRAVEHEIKEVETISAYFRQWLQMQCNTTGVEAAALTSAFVSHSIYQLCIGIAADKKPLKEAMAANLLKSANEVFREHPNYREVCSGLLKIVKNVETVHNSFDSFSDRAIDSLLFQAFLRELKKETNKNLAPFFIDYNAQKQIVRVNIT